MTSVHWTIALWYHLFWNTAAWTGLEKLIQSMATGHSDPYHSLFLPTKDRQNFWTLMPFGKAWVPIQSFLLSKCVSSSSSGLPANSNLNWDQFNGGTAPGYTWGTGGTTDYYGGTGVTICCAGGTTCGCTSSASAGDTTGCGCGD